MEFVKRYVHPDDYRSVILVNKEFHTIFKSMEGTVKLHSELKKGGWISKHTRNVIISKKIPIIELLESLIETFEEKKTIYKHRYIKYKPFNYITVFRIKKRFAWLNLCGF